MLRFPRDLRGYIANIAALSAARTEPLKFSYFFQLHLGVAFLLSAVFTPEITDLVRTLATKLERVPPGISMVKNGKYLVVTGIAQPYVFSDGALTVTVDTTDAIKARPATSTAFIGREILDIAPYGNQPDKKILWEKGGDFRLVVDDFKKMVQENERSLVIILTLSIFAYFFVSSLIFSTMLVVAWSILARLTSSFVFNEKISLRDSLAFHMVAISGPLVLWGLCVAFGLTAGALVEVISFIVYSIFGLRFAGHSKPPEAKQNSVK